VELLQSLGLEDQSCLHLVLSDASYHTSSPPLPSSEFLQRHMDFEAGQSLGFDRLRRYGFSVGEVEEYRRNFHRAVMQRLNESNAGMESHLTDYLTELEDIWINTHFRPQGLDTQSQNTSRSYGSEESYSDLPEDSDEDEDTRSLIQGQDEDDNRQSAYNDATTEDGSLWDLFFGMVLGFFLGLITLIFWLLEPNSSHRYKYGVVAGVSCNIVLGFLHFTRSL